MQHTIINGRHLSRRATVVRFHYWNTRNEFIARSTAWLRQPACLDCLGTCGEVDEGYPDSGPRFDPCRRCNGSGRARAALRRHMLRVRRRSTHAGSPPPRHKAAYAAVTAGHAQEAVRGGSTIVARRIGLLSGPCNRAEEHQAGEEEAEEKERYIVELDGYDYEQFPYDTIEEAEAAFFRLTVCAAVGFTADHCERTVTFEGDEVTIDGAFVAAHPSFTQEYEERLYAMSTDDVRAAAACCDN